MRKRLLPLIAACSTLFITAAVARPCYAQDFPTRPVRVIVPYAAGGGSDITIRIVQAKAMELLGQSLIVDNRAGGGTLIGTRMTQTSPADGYTIGVMDPAFIINPTLVKDAGYDALKDFTPVSLITATPLILVSPPPFPPKTVQELVDHVKANAGKVNYGSPGDGSAGHLAGELLKARSGARLNHVPFRGGAPAMNDLLAGHIPSLIASAPTATAFMREGRIRALAVTGAKRSPFDPEIPTIAELGFPGYAATNWYCLVVSSKVPPENVATLTTLMNKALNAPEVQAAYGKHGMETLAGTAAEAAAQIARETEIWKKVIADAGIRLD